MNKIDNIIILAAGNSSRMKTSLVKCLHKIANKTLLQHCIDTAKQLKSKKIIVVHNLDEEILNKQNFLFEDNLTLVRQKIINGTATAVATALPYITSNSQVLIMYADVAFIDINDYQKLLQLISENTLVLLTAILSNPYNYGRIIRDKYNKFFAVIEEKDLSSSQKDIKEINTGVCIINSNILMKYLSKINNQNQQQEYYFTDIFSLVSQDKTLKLVTMSIKENTSIQGINTLEDLYCMERYYQIKIAKKLMLQGLYLFDAKRFDLRGNLVFNKDCKIDINVILVGNIKLGKNVTIEANVYLKNVTVADNTLIRANSFLENCEIGKDNSIGPFARIRYGTKLTDQITIGNFVELKNSNIGAYTKINHLSYVGDSIVGEYVNFGAGSIICNYDGKNKHQTIIKDGVMIGANNSLIAPLIIAEQACTAAGSTITKNIPEKQLGIARAKQKNIIWSKKNK